MTQNKSCYYHIILFLILLVLVGVQLLLGSGSITISLSYAVLILTATIFVGICLIRILPGYGYNFFDPALVLVGFITLSILPLAAISAFKLELLLSHYPRLGDLNLVAKTCIAHAIFIGAFVICYISTSSQYHRTFVSRKAPLNASKIWLFLAIPFVILDFTFKIAFGLLNPNPWRDGGTQVLGQAVQSMNLSAAQFYTKITFFETILLIYTIGSIVAMSPTIKKARVRLVSILIVLFAVFYFLTTERGFVLMIGLGAAAYADNIRWEGKLLNYRLLALGLVCGITLEWATGIIESFVIYGGANVFNHLTLVNSVSFNPAPVWITSKAISWVDSAEVPLQYGQNYINAIVDMLPSQITGHIETLSAWFVHKLLPMRSTMGIGVGFSCVAEGYFHGKMLGVFIHGLIIGLLASIIRRLQYSRRFDRFGVFFYAVLLAGFYRIYQLGFCGIIAKFQWSIIGVLLLLGLASLIKNVVISQKRSDFNAYKPISKDVYVASCRSFLDISSIIAACVAVHRKVDFID